MKWDSGCDGYCLIQEGVKMTVTCVDQKRYCKSCYLALIYLICGINVSFLSQMMPKQLYLSTTGIGVPSMCMTGSACTPRRLLKCMHFVLVLENLKNICCSPSLNSVETLLELAFNNCHTIWKVTHTKNIYIKWAINARLGSFYNVVNFNVKKSDGQYVSLWYTHLLILEIGEGCTNSDLKRFVL